MSPEHKHGKKSVPPVHVADAAAWVAHLHGDMRTADSDRGLHLWLKEDPTRARVWEVTTEVWDEIGNLQGAAIAQGLQTRRKAARERRRRNLYAVAATLAIGAVGAYLALRDARMETGIGEQRTVALEDGTRVFLNTATSMVVHYDDHQRRIELRGGEALFEVAQRPQRPFVVEVEGHEIVALGTSFVVRREEDQLSVTLVDGKVVVGESGSAATPVPLTPGQRVTLKENQPPAIDQPDVERITAWLHGQVIMEGTDLQQAVREMNRYSRTKVSLAGSNIASLRISGVFRCGDSLSFANAAAATYGLQVAETRGLIKLSGEPKAAYH